MEILKDFIEAVGSRIRSHFFGSIVLAFIGFNWKPLFYLFFADTTVLAKFIYFDGTTTIYTLFLFPIPTGILIALATPWVAWFGTKWADEATHRVKDIQDEAVNLRKTSRDKADSGRAVNRYRLEMNEKAEIAKLDKQQIEDAKAVDEAIDDISDPDLKESTKKNIINRNVFISHSEGEALPKFGNYFLDKQPKFVFSNHSGISFSVAEKEILKRSLAEPASTIEVDQNSLENFVTINARPLSTTDSVLSYSLAITDLVQKGLIMIMFADEKNKRLTFKITTKGEEIAETLFDN